MYLIPNAYVCVKIYVYEEGINIMNLTKLQEIDMLEAIVKRAGGIFIFKKNSPPVANVRGFGTMEMEHMDPLMLEAKLGISFNDIPSSLAPLGGLGALKDKRKLTSIIKRVIDTEGETDIHKLSSTIAHELKLSGMRVESLSALTKVVETGLNKGITTPNALYSLEISPLQYYWEEHHARRSINKRVETEFEIGKNGNEVFINKEIIGSYAVRAAIESGGSFDKFMLDLQRTLVNKNLSMHTDNLPGEANEVDLKVEIMLRDGFDIYQRTKGAHHLRNWVESCEFSFAPLKIKPMGDSKKGINMLRGSLEQNVLPLETDPSIHKLLYGARESIWKWKEIISQLKSFSKDDINNVMLDLVNEDLFPNGVPDIGKENIREINLTLKKVESDLSPYIRITIAEIQKEAQHFINVLSNGNDDVSNYWDGVIGVFEDTLSSVNVIDKLGVAMSLNEQFKPINTVDVNTKIMRGMPSSIMLEKFKNELTKDIGFGPTSQIDNPSINEQSTVKNTSTGLSRAHPV